jgi:small subunit ribosomal protein S26e
MYKLWTNRSKRQGKKKELRAQGAYIASPTVLKWYCISCAIHFKILKIRSADNRRKRGKLR